MQDFYNEPSSWYWVFYWFTVIFFYLLVDVIKRFLTDGKFGSYSWLILNIGTGFDFLQSIVWNVFFAIIVRLIIDVWGEYPNFLGW